MTLVDLLSAKFSSSHFCFCSKSVSHLRTSNTVQVSVGLSTGVGVASLHPFRFLGDRAIGPLSVLSCLTLVYCGQTVGRIKMKLGRKVGLGPGHIVLHGDPVPPPPKGHSPPISAHVRCGQTAGLVKTPLGMEIGLSPGDFVLYRDPAPPKKGAEPPIFDPCPLWPNGCMDQDAIWSYGGSARPKRHSVT